MYSLIMTPSLALCLSFSLFFSVFLVVLFSFSISFFQAGFVVDPRTWLRHWDPPFYITIYRKLYFGIMQSSVSKHVNRRRITVLISIPIMFMPRPFYSCTSRCFKHSTAFKNTSGIGAHNMHFIQQMWPSLHSYVVSCDFKANQHNVTSNLCKKVMRVTCNVCNVQCDVCNVQCNVQCARNCNSKRKDNQRSTY